MQEQKLHGFVLVRMREFAEIGGSLYEYVHEKTGTLLCWLDRPDTNKTFCIAFKTLPEDSTGVFHILEHSVLCGSDKYPVKAPFVELLKSSVRTFINAITFPDKTVYPVSSRNDRDLLNLMDVYLDAVFHPTFSHKPEIFRQEGWRYEGEGEQICRQGVVFNEMKGAFASPKRILDMELSKLLFPDTCYRHVYGGDPAKIPELTYEQFLTNHKKFYHPSNARISLVGSVDLDSCLEKIDGFLREYNRQELCFDIPMQQPRPAQRATVQYAIGPKENPSHRTIVSCATLLSSFDDDLRNDTFSILSDYLTGDDEAPLKRAVLNAGLAQDFELKLKAGIQQSAVYWIAWNTDPERQLDLEQIVRETLTRLVTEGLSRERLESCFRRHAFNLRDRDRGQIPRSLMETKNMLDKWLYGGDPAQGLLVEDALISLEMALTTDFPEKLLRTLFLENEHTVTLTLIPSNTLTVERAAQERAEVCAITSDWTVADWIAQSKCAEVLRVWQQTPDSEAALASIPKLKLSDLAEMPAPLRMTESRMGNVPLLRHETGSSLGFLRAHFEASDLRLDELSAFSVFCDLLGVMGTARYDRVRLPLKLMRTVGRIKIKPLIVEGKSPDSCRILLSTSLVCLPNQSEKSAELLAELLTATCWDDLPMLRDNLRQMALDKQKALYSNGHRFAFLRLNAGLNAHGAAQEYCSGMEYVRWLKRMSIADNETLRTLLMQMEELNRRIVVRERMILSANERICDVSLETLRNAIPVSGQSVPTVAAYPLFGARREGVIIPAPVGFTCMGSTLLRHNRKYHGSFPVMSNVLNYTYLWSKVCVQGGAYDCSFRCLPNGDVFFYSTRDPKPDRSLCVMRSAASFLQNFCRKDPDLTGFILGSVTALDPLLGEDETITTAENRWFSGRTEVEIRRFYSELIHTTPADLLALTPVLEELNAEQAVCVTASKALLDACELDEIISL